MTLLALPTPLARGTQPPDWTQIVALDGNQNNWDPSGVNKDLGGVLATVITSGGINLTGIIAPTITRPDGTSLFELTLIGSSEKVAIKMEDGASSDVNRIVQPIAGGFDAIVYPGQVARFVYFNPLSRWLLLSIDYPVAQVGFSSRVDNTTSPVEIGNFSHGGLVTNKGRTGAQSLSLPNGPFHNFEVTVQRTERGAGETLALKPQGSDVINHPSGDITSAGTIDFAAGEALTLVYDKVNLTWNVRGESKAAAGGGGGAWEFVSTTTTVGLVSSVDITGLDGTAEAWLIRYKFWFDIAAAPGIRVRSGGSFQTTNYRFHSSQPKDNNSAYAGLVSTGTDRFKIPGTVATFAANRPITGELTIYDPAATDHRKAMTVDMGHWDGNNVIIRHVTAHGAWDGGDGAIDQLRFLSTVGNFAIGATFHLFKRTAA